MAQHDDDDAVDDDENDDDDGGGGGGGDDDDGDDNDDDDEHRHHDTRGDDDHAQGPQTGWTSACVRGYARLLAVWVGRGAQAASCLVIVQPDRFRFF